MQSTEQEPVLSRARWRTVDILVASVIAVVFGVIFQVWNLVWKGTEGFMAAYPPGQALIYGVWLIPAVLAAVIIRRPGAAVFTETLAALVSLLLGSPWGGSVVLQGALEGLGVELVFAAFAYRRYQMPIAVVAGAVGGLAAGLFDAIVWYPGFSWTGMRLPYIGFAILSSAVIAGAGTYFLVRAMAPTGVLDRFPVGRERARV
jgi:energy-coupling factor transport system permease protein